MRRAAIALALVAALATVGCGKDAAPVAAPAPVPAGLVPTKVQGERLGFYETEVPGVTQAFSDAGPDSLASDGRLWELRLGDRLVGVLQLTTLLPEVDVTRAEHRDTIVRQLLPAGRDRIDVGDVVVWTSTTSGKSSYLWFGDGIFALLTVKPGTDDAIEPEGVLQDVLDHMVAADGWKYVYFDDEGAEEA